MTTQKKTSMTLEEGEALLATMPEMAEFAAELRALREEVIARREAIDPNGGVVDMAEFEADVHASTKKLQRLLIDALKVRQAELQQMATVSDKSEDRHFRSC